MIPELSMNQHDVKRTGVLSMDQLDMNCTGIGRTCNRQPNFIFARTDSCWILIELVLSMRFQVDCPSNLHQPCRRMKQQAFKCLCSLSVSQIYPHASAQYFQHPCFGELGTCLQPLLDQLTELNFAFQMSAHQKVNLSFSLINDTVLNYLDQRFWTMASELSVACSSRSTRNLWTVTCFSRVVLL